MSKGIDRLHKIYECIQNIEFIVNKSNLKVTQSIEDKIIKPSIRMNILAITRQSSKP